MFSVPFHYHALEEYWRLLLNELTEAHRSPPNPDLLKDVIGVLESGLSRLDDLAAAQQAGDPKKALEAAYWIGRTDTYCTILLRELFYGDAQRNGFESQAINAYLRWQEGQIKSHGTQEKRLAQAREVANAVEQVMQSNPVLNKDGAVTAVAEQIGCDKRTVYRKLKLCSIETTTQ